MWWCWGPALPASPGQHCWPVRGEVVLLEAHHQSGGCAGTFRRGPTPLMPAPPRSLALSRAAATNACLLNWTYRCHAPRPSILAVSWISPMGSRRFGFGEIRSAGARNVNSNSPVVSASGSSASACTAATGHLPRGSQCCRLATAGISASCCKPLGPALCSAACSVVPRWPTCCGSVAAAALGTNGCGGFGSALRLYSQSLPIAPRPCTGSRCWRWCRSHWGLALAWLDARAQHQSGNSSAPGRR